MYLCPKRERCLDKVHRDVHMKQLADKVELGVGTSNGEARYSLVDCTYDKNHHAGEDVCVVGDSGPILRQSERITFA